MATGNVDNEPLTRLRARAGLHAVGSYQVAGLPWLTASLLSQDSTLTCSFPYVTKNITIAVTGAASVRVHFADDGESGNSANHYFTVAASAAGNSLSRFTFDVKCKKVFITEPNVGQTGVEVYAALTGIHTSSMFPLTGRGLDD